MSWLASKIARALWWWMLWLMRRAWMRRVQRASVSLVPQRARPKARRHMAVQNAIARRYGLTVLTVSLNVLLASVALTAAFLVATNLLDSGMLTLPDDMRTRVLSGGR